MSRGSGFGSAVAAPLRVPSDVAAIVIAGTVVTLGLEAMLDAGQVWTATVGYFAAYVGYTLAALRLRRCVLVLQAFALLAVFRLANLAIPAFVDLTVYWLPLLYLPVLPAAAFAIRSLPEESSGETSAESTDDESDDRRDPLAWGAVRAGERDAVGAVVGRSARSLAVATPVVLVGGAGLAVAERSVAPPPDLVPELTTQAALLLAVVVLLAAVVEELLFRGLLQTALVQWLGPPAAVALAAGLFAAMQLPETGAALAVALGAGLFYGAVYEYTHALLAPVVAHALVNVLLFVVLPLYGG